MMLHGSYERSSRSQSESYVEKPTRVWYEIFSMPLYEYECAKGIASKRYKK